MPTDIDPSDLFTRTQAVFKHFNVPADEEPQSHIDAFQLIQTESSLNALLPYFDPSGTFEKFINKDSSHLNVYQDMMAKQVTDFSVHSQAPMTRSSHICTRPSRTQALNPSKVFASLWIPAIWVGISGTESRVNGSATMTATNSAKA
jgi:hypothetical protein